MEVSLQAAALGIAGGDEASSWGGKLRACRGACQPQRNQLGELLDACLGVWGEWRVAGGRDDDGAPQLPSDADRGRHRRVDAEASDHCRELTGDIRVVVNAGGAVVSSHLSHRGGAVECDPGAGGERAEAAGPAAHIVPALASGSNRTTLAERPPSRQATSSATISKTLDELMSAGAQVATRSRVT